MRNTTIICLVFSCFSLIQIRGYSQNSLMYNKLVESFKNPPSDARPKVYWWCLNGNIDTLRARQEFKAMKEAGIGGFDLFEIGVTKEDTMIPGGAAFMGKESLQRIKFAVDEAGKLGLTVGLNLASSWNAGGSWVQPEHGGKSLYASKIDLNGNSAAQSIKLPFPEVSFSSEALIGSKKKSLISFRSDGKPVYYEEIAILAIPAAMAKGKLDTTKIIDLTSFFNPETEELNWKAPAGNWEIYRYVCSNSGQQVVLPSNLSAGLTIDHFDALAVETHLMTFINRLLPVLGDFRKTALKSFYLASYEARGFVWTSTLPTEFRKLNGYDIRKFIPSLLNPDLFDKETNEKIQTDFKKTLSELMINNLYKKSKEICNRYGLKINSEAGGPGYPLYNGPAEPLKAQGAIDIPRGEFWINHSRVYRDGSDTIDLLRVVKEAAAASHIYEKGIVEEEAFTSFQHWQEGPIDMKPYGDRAFCEGMNKVVFHGFSHNISSSGFPGFVYHAGTHFNDKRVWWPKAKPFVDYLARISAIFQKADFKANVLWYYGDKVPNSGRPKNTHFKAGPGYDYEVINTDILINNLSVKEGKLFLTNGAEFDLLALEDEDKMNPEVLKKLIELVKQGATIVGEKPEQFTGAGSTDKDIVDQLWTGDKSLGQKGKIYSEITPLEMLQALAIQPDIDYLGIEQQLLDFIHFGKEDVEFYFVRNTQNEWFSRNVGFRQNHKIPEMWNPVTGEIVPVTIFNPKGNFTTLPLTLAPFGSCFIVFKDSAVKPLFNTISGSGSIIPLLEFSTNGINILEEGTFKLNGSSHSFSVNNKIKSTTLDGPWEISFAKGWGAPEKVVFSKLVSWTTSETEGIKYYSGTATYKKNFQYGENEGTDRAGRIYLDLGEISKVGEVWLNDQYLGITWTKPHRFDVTTIVKKGDNKITIEIANVWSNRLTGDALTGKKYTNTNITSTILPSTVFKAGDQKYYPWAKVPLIESGLLGPVSLKVINPIHPLENEGNR